MSVPIEIAGLEAVLPEIPAGSVIMVEGGADPAKSFLVKRIALTSANQGRRCLFITSHEAEEAVGAVQAKGGGLVKVKSLDGWDELASQEMGGWDVVVDSFSFLGLDAEPLALVRLLKAWRRVSRKTGAIFVLAIDQGMLSEREQVIIEHMADGIIRFRVREESDGVRPYMQIPLWHGGRTFQRSFYFEFTGEEMMIDTRTRLV